MSIKHAAISPETISAARLTCKASLENIRAAIAAAEAVKPWAGKQLTRRILPQLTEAVRAVVPDLTGLTITDSISGKVHFLTVTRNRQYSDAVTIRATDASGDRRIRADELDKEISDRRKTEARLVAALAEFDANAEQWNRLIAYIGPVYDSLYSVLSTCKAYNAQTFCRL